MKKPHRRIQNLETFFYDYKPPQVYKNFPWPRIETDYHGSRVEIPLKEEYRFRSMDFLDSKEALPIFEIQADMIMEQGIKSIVDVGCRHGPVLNILYERSYLTEDFKYMGFDTSPEPIQLATETWIEFDNIEFRIGNMFNTQSILVDFDVECVIFSGILLYAGDKHMELFDFLMRDLYKARWAIIQEPCGEQDPEKFLPWLDLHTIDTDLNEYAKNAKSYSEYILDCDIWQGRRKVCMISI